MMSGRFDKIPNAQMLTGVMLGGKSQGDR
jgi:hypothetical protein